MDTGKEIRTHLTYVTEHLTNLLRILMYLLQNNIISSNEKEEIESGKTTEERNLKLLYVIERKDISLETFLDLLRSTKNEHCADTIEGISNKQKFKRNPQKLLKNIWWPEDKLLIKSLYKRKIGGKSLVEELHGRITKDENRMVVITESVSAAKLTGMGGVGKTLTSKWYAHEYENDYDHVIWIDCGEGSLLISFQKLARDLEVKNRNELEDADDFARKCYEELQEFKCLWVFDNAENYQGDEGIQNILPKRKVNFYCLITSRSREWGTENVGFGNISRLELNIFEEMESLEFLKTNLTIEYKEDQKKELCLLLGNLPLAMQLAVAALNNRKIDLKNYIQKNITDDLEKLVDTKFDDYEKTINKNVQISLNLIKQEKQGILANRLLTIFGYIRPDNVQSKFLMKIMKIDLNVLKETINVLEKYSLVSKTGTVQETLSDDGILEKVLGRNKEMVEMDLLSIHRLLQQVIRHNGKTKEKKNLRRILGCKGFIEYKLIPFAKYANEKLKKEFPKVKAELLDQKQLKKLLKEKRFEECVQLSRFLDKEINTNTTKFNHAICLETNGQLSEAINFLNQLFTKHAAEIDVSIAADILFKSNKLVVKEVEFAKIVDLNVEPTQGEIGRFPFHLYSRLGKNEDALTTLKGNVHEILEIVSSSDILHYLMQKPAFQESVNLAKVIDQEINTMTTKFNYAVCLERNGQVELAVKIMENINSKISKHKNMLTCFKAGDATKHLLNYLIQNNVVLHNRNILVINLTSKPTLQEVQRCLLYFHSKIGNIDENLIQNVFRNEKEFYILLVILSLSDISNYYLKVIGNQIELRLNGQTKEMEIKDSDLDLSHLPQSLQNLSLKDVHVFVSGGIDLPDLKYLELTSMPASCLVHFKLVQLTHIYFWRMEIYVDILPQTVNNIKIINYFSPAKIIGGHRELDKLILRDFSLDQVDQVLSFVHPKQLALKNHQYEPKELVSLMKKRIQTVVVGIVEWTWEDFNESILSKHVDRQSL